MDYYSAIIKTEIMPFEAKWMDLEIIILSEVCSDRQNQKCLLFRVSLDTPLNSSLQMFLLLCCEGYLARQVLDGLYVFMLVAQLCLTL